MQNFTLVEVNLFVVFCSLEIVSRTIHHSKFGFLLLLFPHLIVVVVFFIPGVFFSWHGHEGFKISTPLCYWIKLCRTSPTSCSATIFHQPQAIRTPFDYFHIFSLGQEHVFTNFMSFGAAVDISGVFVYILKLEIWFVTWTPTWQFLSMYLCLNRSLTDKLFIILVTIGCEIGRYCRALTFC